MKDELTTIETVGGLARELKEQLSAFKGRALDNYYAPLDHGEYQKIADNIEELFIHLAERTVMGLLLGRGDITGGRIVPVEGDEEGKQIFELFLQNNRRVDAQELAYGINAASKLPGAALERVRQGQIVREIRDHFIQELKKEGLSFADVVSVGQTLSELQEKNRLAYTQADDTPGKPLFDCGVKTILRERRASMVRHAAGSVVSGGSMFVFGNPLMGAVAGAHLAAFVDMLKIRGDALTLSGDETHQIMRNIGRIMFRSEAGKMHGAAV